MDDARLGAALERFEGEGGPCREEWEIAFPAYGPRLSEQMPVVMDTVVFSCCQSFLTNTRPSRCRKPNLTPSFVPPDSHRDRGNIRQGEVLGMSGCSREGIIWVCTNIIPLLFRFLVTPAIVENVHFLSSSRLSALAIRVKAYHSYTLNVFIADNLVHQEKGYCYTVSTAVHKVILNVDCLTLRQSPTILISTLQCFHARHEGSTR
ncbi:uncharacterized protein EV420DRAFT_710127 [Desarmillaria tabescens]|uniref:Uncharacterized protein n=1 Tax=Armillaria tabescens TaxID=1929756 RepID=A0AA39MY59_ARMTA|nr:uncharacterized protein EV420DRAFT_710127 [Desarmillaria tabescens]KAK0451291.1 hypothetical protein EV420DRAFT_710127 [Desarmillaria tabescens]